MKFKKSISFVLTLCMVLSLFATFVIPVAADDVLTWEDGQINDPADTNPDDGQNLKFDNAYGFTFTLDSDGKINGEDNIVVTTSEAYLGCNPNWAISVLLKPAGDLYEVVTVVMNPGDVATNGLPEAINFDNGNIVLVAHSSYSHAAGANYASKLCALALKVGDKVEVSDTEAYVLIPGVDDVPKAGADLSETLKLWGSGSDISVLTNGKTGVGEIVSWESGLGELFGIENSVTDAAEYSFTVVFDETEFNTVTVYALDFTNGFVPLPGSVAVEVNGVEYETVVTANPNGIATYVAELGEAVTASSVTVNAVMAESTLGGPTFNMFSEVAVSLEETVVKPGVEIVLPEGTGITISDGYGATDILLDGYTGVGEITAHDGNHDKLVCLRNGTTEVESEYSLKVTLDKETAFNVVTLYILSHTGGNVGLPKAVTVNINGVDYEATVAGEDASVVAVEVKLEEAVSANGFTVDVVMNSGNVKYNMYSEIAVSLVEDEPETPATSQVVTDWNVSDWNTSANGANGAYIFTDADAYASATHTWWIHASFKPTTIAGVYEVAAIRGASGTAAFLEIPEGGFVWAAHDSAAAGTAGAFAYAFMKASAVGDRVVITGVDIAAQTTTADATLAKVVPAADMDLLVSHNYNYNWHAFEGQIITMAVGEAALKKAGDAPNMSAEDTDILYIVELVDGAYKVTGVVGGKALLDVEIPENGFLYYVTKNCTGYDKICNGELVGKYLVLGDIDLATKFAIDTQKGNPAYVMKAVSSFKTGDLNLNGVIDATDYAILRKLVLGTLTAEEIGDLAYATADVNGDKVVNARDYYLVKRAFLGTYVIPGWEEDDAE